MGAGQHSALSPASFEINRERANDYLNTRDRLYCVDGFAGWDPDAPAQGPRHLLAPYHALFMHNMLIRPTAEELAAFGEPDYVIYNAGQFPANRHTAGMTSKTSVDLSFEDGEVVILGTEYAGEMKKGVFTIMNYLMPKRGVLSMHCSATADRRTGALVASCSACRAPARRRSRPTRSGCSSATTSTAGPTRASSTSKAAATPRRST